MARRQLADLDVVDAERRNTRATVRTDVDDRHPFVLQARQLVIGEPHVDADQSVDAAVDRVRRRRAPVAPRRGAPMPTTTVSYPASAHTASTPATTCEWYQTSSIGTATAIARERPAASRDAAGSALVVELGGDQLDPLPCVDGDVGQTAQGPADGGDRDACGGRDVFDRAPVRWWRSTAGIDRPVFPIAADDGALQHRYPGRRQEVPMDAATARLAISLVDLTNLNDDCTADDVTALCDRARRHRTAAVCIWPDFVRQAADELESQRCPRRDRRRLPQRRRARRSRVGVISDRALDDGADEIDVVLPYRAFAAGDSERAAAMLRHVRSITDRAGADESDPRNRRASRSRRRCDVPPVWRSSAAPTSSRRRPASRRCRRRSRRPR